MNVVDLTKQIRVVVDQYNHVNQPMFTYTTPEEFVVNMKAKGEKVIVIKDVLDFFKKVNDLIKDRKPHRTGGIANHDFLLTDDNIWVATGEKYIPLTANRYLEINYKLDANGNKIPTKNTFVQLHAVKRLAQSYVCYTSSGIFSIGLNKWRFTAAIRDDWNQSDGFRRERPTYNKRLKTLLERKKPTVRDALLFMNIMNPLSSTYLDPDASVKKVYATEVRSGDREKVVQSERFKLFFTRQLEKLMPELVAGIKKHNNPEIIGKYLADMRANALANGSTDDQIKTVALTLKLAYADEILKIGDPTPIELRNDNVPYVIGSDESINKGVAFDKAKEVDEGLDFSEYDEGADIIAANAQMDDENFAKLKEETGTLDEHIQDDEGKPKADGLGVL
jgi:hypothetical protein